MTCLRSSSSVRSSARSNRRGVAAVLAMLFIAIATTLVVGIYSSTNMNAQAAFSQSDGIRASAASEAGLQWFAWRLKKINRPKTSSGTITAAVANTLWPSLVTSVTSDFAAMTLTAERPVVTTATSLTSSPISLSSDDSRFTVQMLQHPLTAGDTLDQRYIRVISTGTAGGASRTAQCDFLIDKKIRFAVAGRVPIQVGQNTLVEGTLGMATANKYPPFLILSDFAHLNATLTAQVVGFEAWCDANHKGFDNRVPIGTSEAALAQTAGYADTNNDGYIDEYDLFLKYYDKNHDKAITKAEFTDVNTGKLYDDNLFNAIDSLGAPLSSTDTTRAGYQDGKIDNSDGYAKVHGQILMATVQQSWATSLASSGQTIVDMMSGPVVVDQAGLAPVKFSASTTDIFDLTPTNFEDCAANFRLKSGTSAGTAARSSSAISNTTLKTTDANGTAVTDRTPFGSTSYQATYKRPVFKNLTLKNVIVPPGMNALFDNCTFQGVTFVDTAHDITNSSGSVITDSSNGMSWSQRKVSGDTFTADKVLLSSGTPTTGQSITNGSRDGNNLRFNNCTFNGPLAGNNATAYTHFANSWEFTGATLFNNTADQTATIVSPQVNIEMGSFTDPTQAPSTLVGVVVAGNIDIRGTSVVDGSIIITGDGAGNTTLGYFGASDSDTNPSAMPEGGYGRLSIRYNPTRALPDGINIAVDILPVANTYQENQ